jgi:hypothetical protein
LSLSFVDAISPENNGKRNRRACREPIRFAPNPG